jgi:hypothetical protein
VSVGDGEVVGDVEGEGEGVGDGDWLGVGVGVGLGVGVGVGLGVCVGVGVGPVLGCSGTTGTASDESVEAPVPSGRSLMGRGRASSFLDTGVLGAPGVSVPKTASVSPP